METTPPTLRALVAARAEQTPDAPALLAPGRAPLSCRPLLAVMDETGAALRGAGVGPDTPVAVVLPNGPEMAVAFLAAAACAVCAPLNPAYAASEFEFYMADLKAGCLLTERGVAPAAVEVATRLGVPVLFLEPDAARPAGTFRLETRPDDKRGRRIEAGPDDVALVLHTSGTTSRPKIVPLTHRNLCVSAHNIARTLCLSPADRCLNVMPLFHIHGLVGALLSSLAAGGGVACAPGFHVTRFFDWLDALEPTWFTAVPAMHQDILARAAAHREVVVRRPLRFIRSASAALPPPVMAGIEAAFGAPVIEAYGMTEAAHQMASNPLPPWPRKPGSVGLAAGPEVAIMGEEGALLPPGRAGEIVIRGGNVTRGYAGAPEANASAFRDGWFRTGDQGFLDGDGYLFITGRLKEIINRGGEKIAPREIDEALLEHPAVAQAVAFAVPHARLGEEVGAAVVLKPGLRATEHELRACAARRLAAFKIPRVIKMVGAIPRGPTNKVQRIGLAAKLGVAPIDEGAASVAAEYREPRTPLERRLAEIWAGALQVERVGIRDDFFRLGGDSLLAAQLMARVCKELDVDLPLVSFVEDPTVETMAREIEDAAAQRKAASRVSGLVLIQPCGGRPALFCLPGHNNNVFSYSKLVRHLPADQPVFGLVYPMPEEPIRLVPIEDLAAAGIAAMRAHQPAGPYRLVGSCFGGVVAFEMARQLVAQGQAVSLLVMMAAYRPGWKRDLPLPVLARYAARHLRDRLRSHWEQVGKTDNAGRARHLGGRLQVFLQAHRESWCVSILRLWIGAGLTPPRFLRKQTCFLRLAQQRYRLQGGYSGRAILLRPVTPRAGHYPVPNMGWDGALTGEVSCHEVPGQFLHLTDEPAIRTVARWLNEP